MNRSSSCRSSTATRRSGAFAPRSTSRLAASTRYRSTPHSDACWPPTSSRPVDVPSFDRSNVDGFAVMSEDTFGASEEVPRSVALGDESDSHRSRANDGDPVGHGRGDCHRRHGSARRRCGRHDRARGDRRPPSCTIARASDGGKRRVVRRNGHHQRRDRAAPRSAADQPRHRRAGGNRRRCRRRLAEARRRHSLDRATRSSLRASRCNRRRVYDSNAQVLADAVRELGGEPQAARDHPRRHGRPQRKARTTRSRAATSCCSRAARARERATCRIASSPNFAIPGSSRTASRSSPASRSAWPRPRPSGRRAPGLSHVGHLHVSRVRRAGVAAARRSRRSGANRRAGSIGGEGQQRDWPHGVPAGGVGRSGGRPRRREHRSPRIRWDRDPAA